MFMPASNSLIQMAYPGTTPHLIIAKPFFYFFYEPKGLPAIGKFRSVHGNVGASFLVIDVSSPYCM